MTPALVYRSRHKARFATALLSAVAIHLGAIGLATTRPAELKPAAGPSDQTAGITLEPAERVPEPLTDLVEPLPQPPTLESSFIEPSATPPPVRRMTKATPFVRPPPSGLPGSVRLSAAKVFAISAPRPEYPYEARRQKITGDGIAVLTIDPATGSVVQVTMARSTGNEFLDNAAVTGFRRWRFRPGSVASVTCPVTFTLSGFSY